MGADVTATVVLKSTNEAAAVVTVNSVVKAVAILRHLSTAHGPEGVNAIARKVAISPSSCFNILKTLVFEEFVQFDQLTKTYSLGSGVVDLAVAALDPEAGFLRTRPILERIAREHGVTCGLWRRQGARLILLGAAESQEFARIRFTPGNRLPAMIGAMGRCIAAHSGMSEVEITKAIRHLKWAAPPEPGRYLAEVRAAGDQGYAIDDGDFLQGITSVAAPVIGRDGSPTHCIAATTFKGRFAIGELKKVGASLVRACGQAVPLLASVR